MTASKVPLIPVPVEVLTGYLFKSQPEIMCFSIFKFEIIQVKIQRSEKCAVAHIVSQHIQDTASFGISDHIEHVLTIGIVKPHQIFRRDCWDLPDIFLFHDN